MFLSVSVVVGAHDEFLSWRDLQVRFTSSWNVAWEVVSKCSVLVEIFQLLQRGRSELYPSRFCSVSRVYAGLGM